MTRTHDQLMKEQELKNIVCLCVCGRARARVRAYYPHLERGVGFGLQGGLNAKLTYLT